MISDNILLLLPSLPLSDGEGIVTLGVTLSRCVCVRRISLGGEGNALYPVLCRWKEVMFLPLSVCLCAIDYSKSYERTLIKFWRSEAWPKVLIID